MIGPPVTRVDVTATIIPTNVVMNWCHCQLMGPQGSMNKVWAQESSLKRNDGTGAEWRVGNESLTFDIGKPNN